MTRAAAFTWEAVGNWPGSIRSRKMGGGGGAGGNCPPKSFLSFIVTFGNLSVHVSREACHLYRQSI